MSKKVKSPIEFKMKIPTGVRKYVFIGDGYRHSEGFNVFADIEKLEAMIARHKAHFPDKKKMTICLFRQDNYVSEN